MRKLVLSVLPVIVLAFSAGALTGCKNKWVKKAEEIEKAACACKDAKCAKEQRKAFLAFAKESKGVKVAKSDAKKVNKLMKNTQICIAKAMVKRAPKAPKAPAKKK